MTFPCTGCGICCHSVGKWVSIAQSIPPENRTPEINEIATFPVPINLDGSCSQLQQDNSCAIYEKRPIVCSIEGMWKRYHSQEKSLSVYFAEAAIVCNTLMDEAGLPEGFRITL